MTPKSSRMSRTIVDRDVTWGLLRPWPRLTEDTRSDIVHANIYSHREVLDALAELERSRTPSTSKSYTIQTAPTDVLYERSVHNRNKQLTFPIDFFSYSPVIRQVICLSFPKYTKLQIKETDGDKCWAWTSQHPHICYFMACYDQQIGTGYCLASKETW